MVVRILEGGGHRCISAGSCAEALEVLQKEPVDLTLSDIGMPGENGIVLAREIQRDFPTVSVIMVTALADFETVREARSAGAIDYLVKPTSPTVLLAAVERANELRARAAREAPPTPAPAPAMTPAPGPTPARQPVTAESPPTPPTSARLDAPIDRLFREMCRIGASDLHLSATMPPLVRIDGEMIPLERGAPALSAEDVVELLTPIVPGKNRNEFAERHDSDFAYEVPGLARFRANIFTDRNGMGAVFRTVPTTIRTAEQLELPQSVLDMCALRKGLVLVTGPTGSGKSTTLAALIDYINRTRADHIVTIEDPIEFVHTNKRCLVNQREVHTHTLSFKAALRAALREDPDILLIGEMRDLETVSIALETAETGHLVFGTLHTTTAASTIDRIIDQFSADRQAQVRVMLSESLKGVIAQTLCRRVGGGRVAALEVLVVSNAISNLIREGKTFQIPAMMQVGKSDGNVTLNDALFNLVRAGLVAPDEAYVKAVDRVAFETMLSRSGIQPGMR